MFTVKRKSILSRSLNLLVLLALAALPKVVSANTGGQDGGGGDSYVQDFIKVAEFEVLPWIETHGNEVYPSVDAKAFKAAVENLVAGKTIWSEEVVYETCDGSQSGRIVDACYNYDKNDLIISRTRYPLAINNSAIKRRIVAHEIFRKMKLEGDDYYLSNQLRFGDILPNPKNGPVNARCFLSYENADSKTESHFISSQGKSEGKKKTFGSSSEIEFVFPPDFIVQLITYSNAQLPLIAIVGYNAIFETTATIEPGKSTSVSMFKGQVQGLSADCELFQ